MRKVIQTFRTVLSLLAVYKLLHCSTVGRHISVKISVRLDRVGKCDKCNQDCQDILVYDCCVDLDRIFHVTLSETAVVKMYISCRKVSLLFVQPFCFVLAKG
jgi:hypothetical protein